MTRADSRKKNKLTHSTKTKGSPKTRQQVRIVGGQYKRRNLSFVSADGLRPTPDRVRETVFNWLMHDIFEAHVLDTCAGSGVLGFEALSRGAHHVTFIEAHREQVTLLNSSQQDLRITDNHVLILHGQAEQLIASLPSKVTQQFDLVFVDPPYALDLWQPVILELIKAQLIHAETKIYIEADKPIEAMLDSWSFLHGYEVIKSKKMGGVYCVVVCLDIL